MNLSDARVRYTRKVIRESFLALLAEKPITRITVKEICEKSDINRATFYKHYANPFDLLEKLEDELLENVRSVVQSGASVSTLAYYISVLENMREKGEGYSALCSVHGDPSFPAKVFLACYQECFPRFGVRFSNLTIGQREMLYHYLSHGCGGVLSYWLNSGMQEPIEDVAALLWDTTSAACDALLQTKSIKPL